jgi:RNA polymerase sigma factor (sigma-70 family)
MRDEVVEANHANEADQRAHLEYLVNAAREGSSAALSELVTELTPMLWHAARAAGLNQPDAEDVVQTTWLALVAHLEEVRTPAALTGWLITTAKREAWRVRGLGRKQWPASEEWLQAIPDPDPGVAESAIVKDEQRELWTAFHALPGRCQELLRIVAFVPRPDYDAIAGRLGMPRGSVGPTRSRCLDKLRARLNAGGDQR